MLNVLVQYVTECENQTLLLAELKNESFKSSKYSFIKMIKNYKNKKLKKAAKIVPKVMMMAVKLEKEKSRVNLKERVEDNTCNLSLSGLEEVPVRAIASLKCVSILNLSSNNLTFLSRNFCLMLTRLTSLNLSKNHLNSLPDNFGDLVNLNHLDLQDNKLQHLPLSFGNLINLQYLNLKDNPLATTFAKIVGPCSTTADCQEAASNTVSFLAVMQLENKRYLKDIGDFVLENGEDAELLDDEETLSKMLVIPLPRLKKRNKHKSKKKALAQITDVATKEKTVNNILTCATTTKLNNSNLKQQPNAQHQKNYENANHLQNRKIQRGRKKSGLMQFTQRYFIKRYFSSTVLRSIVTFFILLAINIFIIYMIMFKNPELAEKLVEAIPQQYREWIVSKTEIFRVNIGDWIADFLTPPDEQ